MDTIFRTYMETHDEKDLFFMIADYDEYRIEEFSKINGLTFLEEFMKLVTEAVNRRPPTAESSSTDPV